MDSTAHTIQELVNNLQAYNEAYRKGTPLVPDAFYDQEMDRLRALDPGNPWFLHMEPAPVANSRKVKLPVPMKSLYKVKSMEDLKKWLTSMAIADNFEVVITPKFDGLSLLHNELDDMTYSRGGAENEGQNCTEHYKMAEFSRVPSNLLYTYGELVFNRKEWESNFAGQTSPETGDKYKSPRNTAAGLLNRDEPSPLLKHLDFFRYGADTTSLHQNFSTYAQFYQYVCDRFNQPNLYQVVSIAHLSESLLHQLFDEWKQIYYIDGLVIYLNDLRLWDVMGRQATTGNPNYAIAYKNPAFTETFETTVLDVNWFISKSGALKPVVKIDMVDTGDCEMENPTGYNARYISNNNIAPGAIIKVTRSGGVIPKILEVIRPAADQDIEAMWNKLTKCPHCQASLVWNDSGAELCCPNTNCRGKKLAEIVFFYTTVGAENMAEETITKIFNAGYASLRNILDITFEELLDIEGFGEDTANIVLQNNAKIRKGLDVTVLMQASNCFPGIGQVKARQLLEKMSETNRFAFVEGQLELPEPYVMRGAPWFAKASKTEQSFYLGVDNFYEFIAANKLVVLPMSERPKATSNKYEGFKVCFTGIRSKLLEETIMAGGGEIASGVSKKTTHLIVADHSSESTKTQKAEVLGIPILTIEEFTQL